MGFSILKLIKRANSTNYKLEFFKQHNKVKIKTILKALEVALLNCQKN